METGILTKKHCLVFVFIVPVIQFWTRTLNEVRKQNNCLSLIWPFFEKIVIHSRKTKNAIPESERICVSTRTWYKYWSSVASDNWGMYLVGAWKISMRCTPWKDTRSTTNRQARKKWINSIWGQYRTGHINTGCNSSGHGQKTLKEHLIQYGLPVRLSLQHHGRHRRHLILFSY